MVLTANFRLLADADFFNSRISKIDGSGDLGEHIVKVVQSKTVLITAPPMQSTPPTGTEKEQEKSQPGDSNGSQEAGAPEKEVEGKV